MAPILDVCTSTLPSLPNSGNDIEALVGLTGASGLLNNAQEITDNVPTITRTPSVFVTETQLLTATVTSFVQITKTATTISTDRLLKTSIIIPPSSGSNASTTTSLSSTATSFANAGSSVSSSSSSASTVTLPLKIVSAFVNAGSSVFSFNNSALLPVKIVTAFVDAGSSVSSSSSSSASTITSLSSAATSFTNAGSSTSSSSSSVSTITSLSSTATSFANTGNSVSSSSSSASTITSLSSTVTSFANAGSSVSSSSSSPPSSSSSSSPSTAMQSSQIPGVPASSAFPGGSSSTLSSSSSSIAMQSSQIPGIPAPPTLPDESSSTLSSGAAVGIALVSVLFTALLAICFIRQQSRHKRVKDRTWVTPFVVEKPQPRPSVVQRQQKRTEYLAERWARIRSLRGRERPGQSSPREKTSSSAKMGHRNQPIRRRDNGQTSTIQSNLVARPSDIHREQPLAREPVRDSPFVSSLFPHGAVARLKFDPIRRDELAVSPGDHLRVIALYHDGWALCKNVLGEKGMVPTACLRVNEARRVE